MMYGVLILVLLGLACCADAQRAPCYECEAYKDAHPDTNPYRQIRSHCTYPCDCPTPGSLKCPPNVSVVRDGCGCCEVCARQRGEPCDGNALCDPRKGLVCEFPSEYPTGPGVCEVIKGLPCAVHNRTYDNGETFLLDCRTQCSCQNGTYACASLCPQESISPRGTSCLHPRLVEVPGQCCREWMCDSVTAQRPPPPCNAQFSAWSECSSRCGLGLSTRAISKDAKNNTQLESYSSSESECGAPGGVEVRLCQEKPCGPVESAMPLMQQSTALRARHHHIRKGHECKATQRPSGPVRLRIGPCRSRKRFRPRSCGNCPGACCRPVATHTIRVLFACATRRGHPIPEGEGYSTEEEQLVGGWGGRWLPAPPASLLSVARPGSDLWELDLYKKGSGWQMSSAQIQESWEAPSLIRVLTASRDKRHAGKELVKNEAGGEVVWGIKPNLPKESRQPKRRRIDVRRGGRQGGGRGRRSVASHSFDWSHESASEEELVTLSVQWIEKCRCSEPCPETPAEELNVEGYAGGSMEEEDDDDDGEGDYKVTNGRGEMILHRVHRAMKP